MSEERTDYEIEMARRISAAVVSCQMRVSYQTAYKNYCADKVPGELWFLLGEIAQKSMNETLDKFLSAGGTK